MNFDPNKYVVNADSSIKEAMQKVDENKEGFIFGSDSSGKIIGLATDGDIRRGLIEGANIDSPISVCLNANFMSADVNTSRQQLIKKLDSHINFVPILDDAGRLVSIISRDYTPIRR